MGPLLLTGSIEGHETLAVVRDGPLCVTELQGFENICAGAPESFASKRGLQESRCRVIPAERVELNVVAELPIMQLKSPSKPFLALLFFAPLSVSMVCAQGGASASQSVTVTIPASVSQDGFTGSVPAEGLSPSPVSISFLDAIDRGLKQNLGLLLSGDNTLAVRGEKWKELSNLLPNIVAKGMENAQQTGLTALGLRIPGFPRVIGPFNYLDARAFLNQSVFNWNYIQKERAAAQSVKAAEYSYREARELVVLVTGNAYLQAIAGAARIETAEAQVKTSQTLSSRASDQQRAGVIPAIDALRAQVELHSRQQQLIVARNEFAKQKLALARIIGLPLGQEFVLSDKAPYRQYTTPPVSA
jgi:outer membrane protein TolC